MAGEEVEAGEFDRVLSVHAGAHNILAFLGNERLNTTLIYACAHDQTVAEDYFAAMSRIETRLSLAPEPEAKPVGEPERTQLLALTERLVEPELSFELRLEIASQLRGLLAGQTQAQDEAGTRTGWIPPPRSPALVDGFIT